MKNIFLTLVIVFAFGMNANAQSYTVVNNTAIVKKIDAIEKSLSSDKEYISFTKEQKKIAKKIAKKKLGNKMILFGSSLVYKEKTLYWCVVRSTSTYTFKSNVDFTNVTFEKTPGTNAKDYARKDNL